jgi:homoserine O-succinyltransferase
MVVNIESSLPRHERPSGSARLHRRKASSLRSVRPEQCLTIGLLNNMAGAAFKATERQFVTLLDAASASVPIQVSYFTLPGLSQNENGGEHFSAHYADVDSLWGTHLDGLIVTGREPKMASLRDEPYWQSFTQVLDWARANTYSTAWSCLAAHAAVLYMYSIARGPWKAR